MRITGGSESNQDCTWKKQAIATLDVSKFIVLVEDSRLRQVDAAGDCSDPKQSPTEREST